MDCQSVTIAPDLSHGLHTKPLLQQDWMCDRESVIVRPWKHLERLDLLSSILIILGLVLNERYSLHAQVSQKATVDSNSYGSSLIALKLRPVSAYDRLFTNHDNLTNAWGAFWAEARNVQTCPQRCRMQTCLILCDSCYPKWIIIYDHTIII